MAVFCSPSLNDYFMCNKTEMSRVPVAFCHYVSNACFDWMLPGVIFHNPQQVLTRRSTDIPCWRRFSRGLHVYGALHLRPTFEHLHVSLLWRPFKPLFHAQFSLSPLYISDADNYLLRDFSCCNLLKSQFGPEHRHSAWNLDREWEIAFILVSQFPYRRNPRSQSPPNSEVNIVSHDINGGKHAENRFSQTNMHKASVSAYLG